FERRRPRRAALLPYTTLFRSTTSRTPGEARVGLAGPAASGFRGFGSRAPVRGEHFGGRHARCRKFSPHPSDIWRVGPQWEGAASDRKSTRLNSSHVKISYAVF